MSNSLQPNGMQHSRPAHESPTPGAYSNSWPSNHLILCRPLLLPPSIFPSIGVFSSKSLLHIRWPEYWSFSVSISPSSEYSGLISWSPCSPRDSQSLLQHHSSNTSIFWCSAFFIVQLSHPYMTPGKTEDTRWTFIGKVMSLLFDMLSRLVIAFLPEKRGDVQSSSSVCWQWHFPRFMTFGKINF